MFAKSDGPFVYQTRWNDRNAKWVKLNWIHNSRIYVKGVSSNLKNTKNV